MLELILLYIDAISMSTSSPTVTRSHSSVDRKTRRDGRDVVVVGLESIRVDRRRATTTTLRLVSRTSPHCHSADAQQNTLTHLHPPVIAHPSHRTDRSAHSTKSGDRPHSMSHLGKATGADVGGFVLRRCSADRPAVQASPFESVHCQIR